MHTNHIIYGTKVLEIVKTHESINKKEMTHPQNSKVSTVFDVSMAEHSRRELLLLNLNNYFSFFKSLNNAEFL